MAMVITIAVALSMLAGYFAGRAHEIFKRVRFNRELLADMQKTTQMARELAAQARGLTRD